MTSMTEYGTTESRSYSRYKLAGLVVLVPVCIGLALILLTILWPVSDSTLTPEQRRTMDIVLFNELYARDSGRLKDKERRYKKLKEFADNGFEPAALAILLYDIKPQFGWRDLVFDWPTYWRIKYIARDGDPSMNCLAATAISDFNLTRDWDKRYGYVRRASDAGQGACAFTLAGFYRRGSKHVAKDLSHAQKLEHEAAKRGDVVAQMALALAYATGKRGLQVNLGKARCWSNRALESGISMAKSNRTSLNIAFLSPTFQSLEHNYPVYDPRTHCQEIVSD